MLKIVSVVGVRPQFIKAAAVSRVLRVTEGVNEILVHTGQHYDTNMSDVFFEELEIPRPDYNLGIGSGTHGKQTGKMLEAIEKVLLEEKNQTGSWFTAIQTPRWPVRWRPSSFIFRWHTLRRACAHLIAECLRRSTGFLRIMPRICSLLPRRWPL